MIRRLFYRGRHHVHTAPRPADGGLVTVSTIAARMRHEAWEDAHGVAWVSIEPDFHPFEASIVRALEGMATA